MCCTLLTLISGTCTLLGDAAAAAAADGPPAADRPSSQQLALFRVNKLSALCLTTLASHAAEAAATLGSPLTALATSQQPEAALLDFLIKVINPDIWKQQQGLAAGDQQGPQAGAAAVLRHLYNRQLYGQLRVLLQAVPAGAPSKSAVEVLVTQMTVRCITLQLVPTRTPPQAASPAAGAAESSAGGADVSSQEAAGVLAHGVSQLLFVPGLWAKCGSLAPVIGRLCSLSLAELSQQPSSKQLLDALSNSSSRSSGGVTISSSSKHRSASEAAAAVDGAAHSLSAWMENLLAATAAGAVLKGVEGDQAIAAQAVSVLLLVLQAGRQVAVLQKHAQRQLKQQQQRSASPHVGAAAAAVGQAGAAASTARASAAFVPGAGFTAGGVRAMEMDEESSSGSEDEMDVEDVTSPKAAAAAAAGSSSSVGAADASAGAAQQQQGGISKAAAKQAVAASAYSGEKAVAQQVAGSSSCLQLLAGTSQGTQLLRKLCALLLPAATADSAAQLQQQLRQGQTAAAVAPGGAAQQQLCALLWTLSRPKQYRQRIWLGLSVGVRLVPRLWFSYISPLHQATSNGLLSLSSTAQGGSSGAAPGTASSSWVQPLLVLAQSYSAALSFTHLEDFYADAAPLVPLKQLYDAANPSVGLVMLLKAAVWQVSQL
jgi:hypothetical protein